jgi:hypothetical protein
MADKYFGRRLIDSRVYNINVLGTGVEESPAIYLEKGMQQAHRSVECRGYLGLHFFEHNCCFFNGRSLLVVNLVLGITLNIFLHAFIQITTRADCS